MYSEKVQYSSFSLGLSHGSHLACCNRLPSSKISCFAVLCLCWFLLPVGTTCLSLFSFWSSLLMCYTLAVPISDWTLLAYTVIWQVRDWSVNTSTLPLVSSLQLIENNFYVIANFLISFLSNFAPPKYILQATCMFVLHNSWESITVTAVT